MTLRYAMDRSGGGFLIMAMAAADSSTPLGSVSQSPRTAAGGDWEGTRRSSVRRDQLADHDAWRAK